MRSEQIKEVIKERFGDILEHIQDEPELVITVPKERLLEVCQFLKSSEGLRFEVLTFLTAVDYDTMMDMVYHLLSIDKNHRMVLKTSLLKEDLNINSVTQIWKAADWYEREVYDMFGINFIDHPDLRRILMPEDFEYHPLRKDYPLEGIESL